MSRPPKCFAPHVHTVCTGQAQNVWGAIQVRRRPLLLRSFCILSSRTSDQGYSPATSSADSRCLRVFAPVQVSPPCPCIIDCNQSSAYDVITRQAYIQGPRAQRRYSDSEALSLAHPSTSHNPSSSCTVTSRLILVMPLIPSNCYITVPLLHDLTPARDDDSIILWHSSSERVLVATTASIHP